MFYIGVKGHEQLFVPVLAATFSVGGLIFKDGKLYFLDCAFDLTFELNTEIFI